MHHMRVLPLRPRTSPRRSRKQRNGPPQSRSRITPGFRYFLMAEAFAALSLDRSDALRPQGECPEAPRKARSGLGAHDTSFSRPEGLARSRSRPSARKGYVLMLPLVQLFDRSRELASMIFCPLDINRRASSARAFISSLNHS
jgi:hypothetical protein